MFKTRPLISLIYRILFSPAISSCGGFWCWMLCKPSRGLACSEVEMHYGIPVISWAAGLWASFIGGGPLQTLTQPVSHTFVLCCAGGEGKQIRALHIHSAGVLKPLRFEGAL